MKDTWIAKHGLCIAQAKRERVKRESHDSDYLWIILGISVMITGIILFQFFNQ